MISLMVSVETLGIIFFWERDSSKLVYCRLQQHGAAGGERDRGARSAHQILPTTGIFMAL